MADKVDSAKKEKGEQDNSEEQAKTEMPRWNLRQHSNILEDFNKHSV